MVKKKANEVYDLVITNERIKIHPSLDFTDKLMFVGVSLPSRNGEGEEVTGHYFITEKGLINSSLEKFTNYYQTIQINIELKYSFNYILNKSSGVSVVSDGGRGAIINNNNNTHIGWSVTTLPTLFQKYIDFRDEEQYTIFSLWTIGTYLHPMFNSYPYVSLFGKKATGKSKTMTLCANLCFNGQLTVGASPSSVYVMAQDYRCSLFFDENDLFKSRSRSNTSQRVKDILPILLNGYKNGSKVPRTDYINGKRQLIHFSVYCPKMFASNYWDEEIFGSRTIPVIMRPAFKEIGDRDLPMNDDFWVNQRTMILDWCLNNWKKVKKVYEKIDNKTKLRNRDWELIKPLIAIQSVLDEEKIQSLCDYFEKLLTERVEDLTDNIDFKVLVVISELAENEYHTYDKIIGMVDFEEDMPSWVNPNWFGRMIKKYGVEFEKRRLSGHREYRFRNVKELLQRFGVIK